MIETLTLIISQVVFSLSRTLNVRYASKEKTALVLLTGFLVKLTWLLSAAIGIKSVIDQDIYTIIVYIASGMVGDYIAMKIKIKK